MHFFDIVSAITSGREKSVIYSVWTVVILCNVVALSWSVCVFEVDGHDSCEDAKTCMQLMLWRLKEDAKKELRH